MESLVIPPAAPVAPGSYPFALASISICSMLVSLLRDPTPQGAMTSPTPRHRGGRVFGRGGVAAEAEAGAKEVPEPVEEAVQHSLLCAFMCTLPRDVEPFDEIFSAVFQVPAPSPLPTRSPFCRTLPRQLLGG